MEEKNNNEIEKKINDVAESVREECKRNEGELIETRFYSEFEIETSVGTVPLKNVFITIERNKEGDIQYHFNWLKRDKEDGTLYLEQEFVLNQDGTLDIKDIDDIEKGSLEDLLKLAHIDVESLIERNDKEKGRLAAVAKEETGDKKAEKDGAKEEKGKTENESEDKEQEEAEEDLKEQGQDLKLSKFRKIKDKNLQERMPETFSKNADYAIAYSSTLGSFVVLEAREESDPSGKTRRSWKVNENIKTTGTNYRSIISVSENGDKVERKVPRALLKTNRSDKEIAITMETKDYGDLNIETVDVMPCQERVARQVRTDGEGAEKQEKFHTKQEFENGGKTREHEIAHGTQKIEKDMEEADEVEKNEITEETPIPETEMTYGQLAQLREETLQELIAEIGRDEGNLAKDVYGKIEIAATQEKLSIKGYIEDYLLKAEGSSIEEKIESAHSLVERDYMGEFGTRKR